MATRNDGLPADQMERAKAFASQKHVFDTTYKNIKPTSCEICKG